MATAELTAVAEAVGIPDAVSAIATVVEAIPEVGEKRPRDEVEATATAIVVAEGHEVGLDAQQRAAAEADAEATADRLGLTLVRANTTGGYRGVKYDANCASRPYYAQIGEGGKAKSLGYHATAQDAALAYARAAAARGRGTTAPLDNGEKADAAQRALDTAAAEGLTLEQISGQGRYKGVKLKKGHNGNERARPYEARISVGGSNKSLGHFATAAEAGLAYARASQQNPGRAVPAALAAASAALAAASAVVAAEPVAQAVVMPTFPMGLLPGQVLPPAGVATASALVAASMAAPVVPIAPAVAVAWVADPNASAGAPSGL